MKILIQERQYRLLSEILNETAAPAVVRALKNLFNVSKSSGDDLLKKLNVLVDKNNPLISRKISSGGAAYNLTTGEQVLKAYYGGQLSLKDAETVLIYIFRESTDVDLTTAIAKHLVNDADPNFLINFKNGSLDFDKLTTKYGPKQSQALKNAILSKSPLNNKYVAIFGDIEPNKALKIINNAIIHADNTGKISSIRSVNKKGIQGEITSGSEILEELINGKITEDYIKLKTLILNSIPPGPLKDKLSVEVKDRIIRDYLSPDYIETFKGKSLQEIKSSLKLNNITNPDVAGKIYKELNPLKGAGHAFGKGINPLADGPFNYAKNIWSRNFSKKTLLEVQNMNPIFKNVNSEDWNKLLFWAFTGVGDYQQIKSIFRIYGFPGAFGNLGGQYVKSYIIANTTYWLLGTVLEAFTAIFTDKQIYEDDYEAFSDFIIGEFLGFDKLFTGPLGRILFNLGQFIRAKSIGGQLPVWVYDVINNLKKSIGIAKINQTDAQRNLDAALRQAGTTTGNSTSTTKSVSKKDETN